MKKIALLLLLPAFAVAQTKYSNESQLTMIQTGGNSNVETYSATTKTIAINGMNNYEIGGHYVLGMSELTDANGDDVKTTTARNWDVYVKYTRDLSEKLGVFARYQIESDEFSVNQRNNMDLGAKYSFIKSDKKNFFAELSVRQSHEQFLEGVTNDDGDAEQTFNKAVLFTEYNRIMSDTLSYRFWAEYVPNFTESDDYLITFEPSVAVTLSTMFSLKLAYKGVYDNQPAELGGERNEYLDYTTTTSLIAKF